MTEQKPEKQIPRPSETKRRRGKDNPPNRNNRTAEDQPFYVPERYRF